MPGSPRMVLSMRPERLTNDFFVDLLDMSTLRQPVSEGVYEGRDTRKLDRARVLTPMYVAR
jgi:catalase (peroxidase I)